MIGYRSRHLTAGFLALLVALGTLTGLALAATAVETQPEAANLAIEWLRAQQLDNGAFPGFSGDPDPSTTADAIIAFASAGIDPAAVTSASGDDPVSYLRGVAGDAVENPGAAGKTLVALHAAQGSALDPKDVNGVDLIAAIQSGFDAETGTYGQGFFNSAYAILGLRAAGQPVESAAVQTLLASQLADGSWSFSGSSTTGTGDSNTTSIVIMALVASGAGQGEIVKGLEYLARLQLADGSIAFESRLDPLVGDANSTALAIQAFTAAGWNPSDLDSRDAVAALATFQLPGGALTWQKAMPVDNMFATVQAIPALRGWALPVAPLGAMPEPIDGPGALEIALQPATGLGIDGCTYQIETFHNVCGPFAEYWAANGGLKIFGYALTEPFIENGVAVQYFERTRLEHHPGLWPENFDILQGRLGAEQLGIGG